MVRRKNDQYFTPRAVTNAIVDALLEELGPLEDFTFLEPHCGKGGFIKALHTKGVPQENITGNDIELNQELSACFPLMEFTDEDFLSYTPKFRKPDFVIGNPPFTGAEHHVNKALTITNRFVGFLLRLAFLESTKRYRFWKNSWGKYLRVVWVLSARPKFINGRTDSTAYGVFLWDLVPGTDAPKLKWINTKEES